MRVRGYWVATALVVSAFAAGCGGCRGKDAGEPTRSAASFLPARPLSAVVVPAPEKLGRTVKELETSRVAGLAATAAGARDTAELVRPVLRQLGFDPRTPEGFAEAGIDGSRSLAYGDDGAGRQVLVIAVSDPGRFDTYVSALARRFGGVQKAEAIYEGTEEAPAPKRTLKTFATEAGQVQLAYGIHDGFAVIGTGKGAVDAVGGSLSRPSGQGLDGNPAYLKLLTKLGERDLYGWLPSGLGQGRAQRFKSGVAFGIDAATSGLNVRVVMPQGPLQVAVIHAMGKVAGAELVSQLGQDDFLAVRLGGEPPALQPLLGSILPRGMNAKLRRAGIDPVTDVLGLLQPGIVLGFELNPAIDLSRGLPTDPSIARTNPFNFVQAKLVAKVVDREKAAQVLEKLAAGAGAFQMQVAREEREGAIIYRATYAAGEGMSWSLVGDTLIATGGAGKFEKAMARLIQSKNGGPTKASAGAVVAQAQAATLDAFIIEDPAARKIFESAGSAAHLDMARLTKAMRAIPESAYGIGGFRLKGLMESWVELLDEVKGVTASFSIDEEGMIVDANVGLK